MVWGLGSRQRTRIRYMAEARSRVPRVRMPKVTLPGRSGKKPTATKAKAEPAKKAEPSKKPEAATKPAAAPATKAAPAPNMQERMEGLQGWMAEIERKQGRLTYFAAAGIAIAVLAAGAALYFGITAKSDSASKDDFDALSKKVDELEGAVTKNTEDTQQTLNSTVAQLQASISDLQRKQALDAANISTLQSQAASGAFNAKGSATTVTPGTTTTTPKNP